MTPWHGYGWKRQTAGTAAIPFDAHNRLDTVCAMRGTTAMTFTRFDRGPVLRAVEDFGGYEKLPTIDCLPDGGIRETAAGHAERAFNTGNDDYTLWEADYLCCDFLMTHPAMLYGELWWEAEPPTFPSREVRDDHIIDQLDAGIMPKALARRLGVDRATIFNVHKRIARRGSVRGNAKYDVAVIRSLKTDLAAGHTRRDVHERYGLPKGTVAKIARGEAWAWVDVASAA